MERGPIVAFMTGAHGDWGGASRVIYTAIRNFDRSRITPLVLLPRTGPIEEELDSLGIEHVQWGKITEPGNPLKYVCALVRALIFFRSKKVRALHVNFAFWRPAEVLAARLIGIPIFAHYHLPAANPGPFMRFCRSIISVSKFISESSGPSDVPRPVIYNPVDLSRFDRDGAGGGVRPKVARDHVTVSFIGQIRDIKGVEDFIEMAGLISDPSVRFCISGECRDPTRHPGSLTEGALRELISGDPRVEYTGYVKAIEGVYGNSDIIVFPSRWDEPLGLIALEAGACGKPVVATRVGGIPEVIVDGENGFLCPPRSPRMLAERVLELIKDPELRATMGENGRKRVEQYFTVLPLRQLENLITKEIASG